MTLLLADTEVAGRLDAPAKAAAYDPPMLVVGTPHAEVFLLDRLAETATADR